ncbi:hypothetical protein R6Q57_016081 [Mikania cordata]
MRLAKSLRVISQLKRHRLRLVFPQGTLDVVAIRQMEILKYLLRMDAPIKACKVQQQHQLLPYFVGFFHHIKGWLKKSKIADSNRMRIKLATKMQSLKEIMPAARNNINTQFIVLEKGRTTLEGDQNKTCLGLVADEAASVHFQFWNEECESFHPGDILRLSNGIFSYNRNNNLVLRAGKRGKIEKVGEFTMVFVESPNMSEILWVPDPNNSGKYIQESVISSYSRIFPPNV